MQENNFTEDFDVVIAGGSFAGLYLASILSDQKKVCVVEKEERIGKLNTTGSTFIKNGEDIFSTLNISRDNILNKYNSFSFNSPHQHYNQKFPEDIWCLLDIEKVKNELLEKSKNAQVLLNSSVGKIYQTKTEYTDVDVSSFGATKKISSKFFVDATGSSTVLARQAGIHTPKHLSYYYQIDADSSIPFSRDTIYLYIGFDFCPGAYAYVFPITDKRVRIGTGVIPDYAHGHPNISAEVLFQRFLNYLGMQPSNVSNVVDVAVYTGGLINKNYSKNLISIGDCAGQISPIVGEGIRFAFSGALISKEVIMNYLKGDKSALKNFNTK